MKIKKEIWVALLAIVALFLLYFGWNFLKGVNIFHATNTYVVRYEKMNGLVEQAPIYVRGFKVGQVDEIRYDFTSEQAFTVTFSINEDIVLPMGTEACLVADGLLGGEAVELRIPTGVSDKNYHSGDTLPTKIESSMLEGVAEAMTSRFDPILSSVDSILNTLESTLSKEQLASIMSNVDGTMRDVHQLTGKLDRELPVLLDSVQGAVGQLRLVAEDVHRADLPATIARVDTAVSGVNTLLAGVNNGEGTLGMLLYDKALYHNLTNTAGSADSLLIDLKAHPKRYVHFSLFGGKKE